jgi:hypothetical protein
MKIIDKEFILECTMNKKTGIKSINQSQCRILGFEFKDLKKGWTERFIGYELSDYNAKLFRYLKGVSGKANQEYLIKQFTY